MGEIIRAVADEGTAKISVIYARDVVEALGADIKLFYNDYNAIYDGKRSGIKQLLRSINTYAKDENGETVSGLKKKRVREYIDSLDIDDGAKLILFKAQGYKTSDEENIAIVEYMDSREDISYEEMVEILTELGFTVNGSDVSW